MADDRRDARSPPQVDDPPEGAEQAGGEHRVRALQQVARPERRARDQHADHGPAEPDLEAVEQKRALHFFTHAAGRQHDEREQPRIAGRAQQFLQRVRLDGVEPGNEAPDRQEHGDADGERDENHRDARHGLAHDRAAAQQHVARPLAVRVHHDENQSQQEQRVAEREHDHVADTELSMHERLKPERRQRPAERELREVVGADQHFDEGHHARRKRDGRSRGLGARGLGRGIWGLAVRVW